MSNEQYHDDFDTHHQIEETLHDFDDDSVTGVDDYDYHEDAHEDCMTDAEADADTFRSCGWGTDEDYGSFDSFFDD